jgi:hypothetical protein
VTAYACAPKSNVDPAKSGGQIRVEGDLPCDVEVILANVCQYCHTSPPRNGAPFPLVTYSDTQAQIDGRPVYEYMETALAMGRMPLPPMSLTAKERATLIAWAADGGPRRATVSCAIGDGGLADAARDAADAAVDGEGPPDAADAGEDGGDDSGM